MNRRAKLILSGLGFLGAIGITLLVIKKSFQVKGLLEGSSWGGHLRTRKETDRENYDLNLDSPERNNRAPLNIFDNATARLPKVELNLEGQNNELNLLSGQNGEDINSIIKSVFSEINKEGQVTTLDGKISPSFEQLLKTYLDSDPKKIQTHLSNFSKLKQLITRWSQTKKSNPNKIHQLEQPLSQAQRQSLQKIYELHHYLKNKKGEFSSELGNIDEEYKDKNVQDTRNDVSFQDVKNSLRLIGWSENKVRIQKQPSARKRNAHQINKVKNDWGAWDNNPYKSFYNSSEEFEKDLSSLNSSLGDFEKSISRVRTELGQWGWSNAQRGLTNTIAKIAKQAEDSHSHIEAKVAEKILQLMGLL